MGAFCVCMPTYQRWQLNSWQMTIIRAGSLLEAPKPVNPIQCELLTQNLQLEMISIKMKEQRLCKHGFSSCCSYLYKKVCAPNKEQKEFW